MAVLIGDDGTPKAGHNKLELWYRLKNGKGKVKIEMDKEALEWFVQTYAKQAGLIEGKNPGEAAELVWRKLFAQRREVEIEFI